MTLVEGWGRGEGEHEAEHGGISRNRIFQISRISRHQSHQDSLRLQCRFRQETALLLGALAAPLLPLLLLAFCVVLEAAKPAAGLLAAQKVQLPRASHSLFLLAWTLVAVRDSGVRAGLKAWQLAVTLLRRLTTLPVCSQVLTFFFIGGASSCADLWSCQRFDGGPAQSALVLNIVRCVKNAVRV